MDVTRFKQKPIMGILRGVELKSIEPLFEAVISGGLETIEITMNTDDAAKLISKAVKVSAGRMMVGAGTVLNLDSLHKALDSGASFVVMPTLVMDVMDYCTKNNIPVFPGAFTPQEIFNAWNAGASMVKVFPAKFFGPDYFKEIKGPFNDIELLACGGVTTENIKEFFKCGASAVAFGGSVFDAAQIKKREFGSIKESIRSLLLRIERRRTKDEKSKNIF